MITLVIAGKRKPRGSIPGLCIYLFAISNNVSLQHHSVIELDEEEEPPREKRRREMGGGGEERRVVRLCLILLV